MAGPGPDLRNRRGQAHAKPLPVAGTEVPAGDVGDRARPRVAQRCRCLLDHRGGLGRLLKELLPVPEHDLLAGASTWPGPSPGRAGRKQLDVEAVVEHLARPQGTPARAAARRAIPIARRTVRSRVAGRCFTTPRVLVARGGRSSRERRQRSGPATIGRGEACLLRRLVQLLSESRQDRKSAWSGDWPCPGRSNRDDPASPDRCGWSSGNDRSRHVVRSNVQARAAGISGARASLRP